MWRTIGQEKLVNTLTRGLAEGRQASSYLLVGPPHVGKTTLATDIARFINCTGDEKPCGECLLCERIERGLNTDVRVITKDDVAPKAGEEKKRGPVKIMRDVVLSASLKPSEGNSRIFIIQAAELLNISAANVLLKTLEEPPEQTVWILLATTSDRLLPTIVSRCQKLELRPANRQTVINLLMNEHGAEKEHAEKIAHLCGGRIGWAIQAISDASVLEEINDKLDSIEEVLKAPVDVRFDYALTLSLDVRRDRESAQRELELWIEFWRDVMLVRQGLNEHIKHLGRHSAMKAHADELSLQQIARVMASIKQTMRYLEQNANARLAIENMMLSLPQL